MAGSGDTISLSALGEHKDAQSLWVAVHGKVYDLTTFASDHPGGVEVLLDVAGADATEPFEYAGHTDDAVATMQKFHVGPLEGAEADKLSVPNLAAKAAHSAPPAAAVAEKASAWARPAAVVALVVVLVVVAARAPRGLDLVGGLDLGGLGLGGEAKGAQAFFGGLVLASSVSVAGLVFLYTQFSKTLEHEKSVFAYPSYVPRRPRK